MTRQLAIDKYIMVLSCGTTTGIGYIGLNSERRVVNAFAEEVDWKNAMCTVAVRASSVLSFCPDAVIVMAVSDTDTDDKVHDVMTFARELRAWTRDTRPEMRRHEPCDFTADMMSISDLVETDLWLAKVLSNVTLMPSPQQINAEKALRFAAYIACRWHDAVPSIIGAPGSPAVNSIWTRIFGQ